MNNNELQKTKEYEQLASFINNTQFLTCDTIIPLTSEQEPPDFMLLQGNKRIGIELTELIVKHLIGKHNPKELECFQNRMLQQISNTLNEKMLPCLTVEVEVHFAKPPDYQKGYESSKIVYPLTEQIVKEVRGWDKKEHKSEYISINNIPGICGILIRSGVCMGEQWLPNNRLKRMSIHWVRHNPLAEVMEALTKKELKLANYCDKYDEVYLLLLGDRYTGSQAFELTDEFTQNTLPETKFDRVFYYDMFHRRGLELKKTTS